MPFILKLHRRAGKLTAVPLRVTPEKHPRHILSKSIANLIVLTDTISDYLFLDHIPA